MATVDVAWFSVIRRLFVSKATALIPSLVYPISYPEPSNFFSAHARSFSSSMRSKEVRRLWVRDCGASHTYSLSSVSVERLEYLSPTYFRMVFYFQSTGKVTYRWRFLLQIIQNAYKKLKIFI